MRQQRLLQRLGEGNVNNVRFRDFLGLVEGFGFRFERISGSHYVYTHGLMPGTISLQDVKGQAKPYQIRQFLKVVEKYNLELRDSR